MQFKRKLAVRRNTIGKRFRGAVMLRDVVERYNDADLADLLEMGYELIVPKGGTTSSNTVLANPIYLPRAVVVSSDQTINQGDMVRWDGVNYTLKPLTDPTQVAFVAGGVYGFIGVAQGQANPNVYPAPAAGTPSENLPGVVVQRGGTVRLKSVASEGNYTPYEPVTVGAGDAQTVSRASVTTANRVGLIIVPPPVSARGAPGATPAPETVTSGQAVEVWIEPKFPSTVLL